MGSRFRASVAALVVAAAVPASAGAVSIPLRGAALGGPVLTKHGVAWAARDSRHRAVLFEGDFGRTGRGVQAWDEAQYKVGLVSLAGTANRVVAAVLREERGNNGNTVGSFRGADLMTAGWRAQLAPIRPLCGSGDDQFRSFDASGDVVAYSDCSEQADSSGRSPAAVEDFSSDPPGVERYPGAGFGVRVAGRYLAWLGKVEPTSQALFAQRFNILVYDRVAQRQAYSIPAHDLGGGIYNFDLQSDGKVAVAYATRKGDHAVARVAWASPSRPHPRALALKPMDSYNVKIANNTIAFERGSTGATEVPLAQVGVSDLSGHARVIARNGEANLRYESFDYDGHRIAWWAYGCHDERIQYLDASRTGPGAHRRGCRLTFSRPPRLTKRAVQVAVDCFGFVGCRVPHITVALRGNHRAVLGAGRDDRARLTPLGRATAKRRTHVAVRISATIVDAAGRRERRAVDSVLRPD